MTVPSLMDQPQRKPLNRWGVERPIPLQMERDAWNKGMFWYGGRWQNRRLNFGPDTPQARALEETRQRISRFNSGVPFFTFTPEQRLNLEGTFGENFQTGLGAVAPNFGSRYGRILQRNPFAVQSAFERANIENPNTGVLDFFESSFDPENFAAGLSSFERGDNPRAFTRRQRTIFR